MEVILAAGVFAMAGVGFAVALNDIAKASNLARIESEVRLELQTQINLARLVPLVVRKETTKPNSAGVTYETEVNILEMTNDDKFILQNLYKLTVTARWKQGLQLQEEKAEVYVYQP